MKIAEEFSIKQNADIIYTKRMLQSHFDEGKFIDKSFFILAFMELATNLIKHTKGGKVFLIEEQGYYLLGIADCGQGIANVAVSLHKGYTTAANSLGLGLYQLSTNDCYDFEIFSTTKKDFHGTTILLKPKELHSNTVFLSKPFLSEPNNGDFFAKKGKFLLFGDASGHNKKSHKTADFITQKFFSTPLSCIMINNFFESTHQELHAQEMRGAVCLVGEIVKNNITLCGVGDLSLWVKENDILSLKTFKNGIIGEVFSSVKRFDLTLTSGEFCVMTTDGIEQQSMGYFKHISMQKYSAYFIAFTMLYFTGSKFDDSSLLVIKN